MSRTSNLLNKIPNVEDGGDNFDYSIHARCEKCVAVAFHADELEDGWCVVVQAIGACELVEQEQHHCQEEALEIASVGEDILQNEPDAMSFVQLPSKLAMSLKI